MQNLEGRTELMLDPEPRTEPMEALEARTGFTEELAEESIQNTVEDAEKEKTYRDIHERTFEFACNIVRLHSELIRHGVTRRSVVNQLLRSATSVGANLEEARGGQSKADFINKCRVALKEARESHYWLRILERCELGPPAELGALVSEANELVAILTTIVKNASLHRS